MSNKLYNVMSFVDGECAVIDESVTEHQAEYLRHWHIVRSGEHHWKMPVGFFENLKFSPIPGIDSEARVRNAFEEDRANHVPCPKWHSRWGRN